MKLFKSQMLRESFAPASAVPARSFGHRYDRRRPHVPQLLQLEYSQLLQLGHEVVWREPANTDVDRAA